MEYIEQICRESKETKISKLYSFCKEKLSNKYNISYPTFYRIVSNLDGFFNKSSNFHMKKIKRKIKFISFLKFLYTYLYLKKKVSIR